MSSDPTQGGQASVNPLDAQQIEQARKQINQLTEEIAQLAETDIQPAIFYSEFLQKVYFAMQAVAGAVWIKTPQGNLQLQCQINLKEVGLDRTPDGKPMHDELLRQAVLQAKGGILRPQYSHAFGGPNDPVAGNPTDFTVLLVPILQEKQVIGLAEIWEHPNRDAGAFQNLFQFLVRLAAFVSIFHRNHQLRTMVGQQETWLKLEAFSRQIHGTLHVTECAYLIANESRRLIEVDRISVATRMAGKCAVTAISGADVVEKRSNLVQLMRALFDAVIEWGERLVYTGTKDETLPPDVVHALDAYLQESNSKILVVMPLLEDRDKEGKKRARSALMMECFESKVAPDLLLARLDVVGRHSGSALYNAVEHHRIPMRFIWQPLAYVQDGLGGKTKAITASIVTGVVVLLLALIFVPFPLKMEANGQALPILRNYVYPTRPGKIYDIPLGLKSGSRIAKGQTLFSLVDPELAKDVRNLDTEIRNLQIRIAMPVRPDGASESVRSDNVMSIKEAQITLEQKIKEREALKVRDNANLADPGTFTIAAPRAGMILSGDFRDQLLGKMVKPGEPLIRIGYSDTDNPKIADWELELKIPQKHVGQVLRAFERTDKEWLDVDVLFSTEPTASYRAKLRKDKIAKQATTQKDDNNETEPVVLAWARVHPLNNDIAPSEQIPGRLLLSGSEVHTRIRCGNAAMGYSLFYGVWEFAYEKVIFPYGW